jgi:hypothetical protein
MQQGLLGSRHTFGSSSFALISLSDQRFVKAHPTVMDERAS